MWLSGFFPPSLTFLLRIRVLSWSRVTRQIMLSSCRLPDYVRVSLCRIGSSFHVLGGQDVAFSLRVCFFRLFLECVANLALSLSLALSRSLCLSLVLLQCFSRLGLLFVLLFASTVFSSSASSGDCCGCHHRSHQQQLER